MPISKKPNRSDQLKILEKHCAGESEYIPAQICKLLSRVCWELENSHNPEEEALIETNRLLDQIIALLSIAIEGVI